MLVVIRNGIGSKRIEHWCHVALVTHEVDFAWRTADQIYSTRGDSRAQNPRTSYVSKFSSYRSEMKVLPPVRLFNFIPAQVARCMSNLNEGASISPITFQRWRGLYSKDHLACLPVLLYDLPERQAIVNPITFQRWRSPYTAKDHLACLPVFVFGRYLANFDRVEMRDVEVRFLICWKTDGLTSLMCKYCNII